jgi:hypothetical protein
MNLPQRTRGSVAIKKASTEDVENNWLGVYINDKSNPIEFGPQIWKELQDHWQCLNRFASNLLKCAYWDEYKNDGLCPYCGKFGVGQPNNVAGHIVVQYAEKGPESLAPDPMSVYHNHIIPQPALEAKGAKGDGLWIEWVYVVDPKTYSLDILKAVRDKGSHTVTRHLRQWPQENYKYISVAFCSLFNNEPNWDIIEKRGINMACYHFNKVHKDVSVSDFGFRRTPRG